MLGIEEADPLERGAERRDEPARIGRLDDARLDSDLARRLVEAALGVGGHQDDRELDALAAKGADELRPELVVGQPVIGEEHVGAPAPEQLERLGGRSRLAGDPELGAVERLPDPVADDGVVVDDEHGDLLLGHELPLLSALDSRTVPSGLDPPPATPRRRRRRA